MESTVRVSERFKRAQEDALDTLADQTTDRFLDELASLAPFAEKRISQVLANSGLNADDVNALSSGKSAGEPLVQALGGLILRGLWFTLVRPFAILQRLIVSSKFRRSIKAEFKRALRKEGRDTRHMLDVASRWARGDQVHPNEFKAARQQLLRILVQVLLVYFASPEVAGLFAGGLWSAIGRLALPAEKLLVLLLERPLRAVAAKLLTAPTT